MTPEEEQRALRIVVDRVRERHPDVEQDDILRRVSIRAQEFEGRPVRDFVPLLVERGVLAELRV